VPTASASAMAQSTLLSAPDTISRRADSSSTTCRQITQAGRATQHKIASPLFGEPCMQSLQLPVCLHMPAWQLQLLFQPAARSAARPSSVREVEPHVEVLGGMHHTGGTQIIRGTSDGHSRRGGS
jgi:hypothetical protein